MLELIVVRGGEGLDVYADPTVTAAMSVPLHHACVSHCLGVVMENKTLQSIFHKLQDIVVVRNTNVLHIVAFLCSKHGNTTDYNSIPFTEVGVGSALESNNQQVESHTGGVEYISSTLETKAIGDKRIAEYLHFFSLSLDPAGNAIHNARSFLAFRW